MRKIFLLENQNLTPAYDKGQIWWENKVEGGGKGECFGSFSTFIQCLKTEKKRKEDGKGEELKCLLLKKEIPDGML